MEKLIEKITDKTDAHISYDKAVLALSKVMAGLMKYKLCKIGDAELPRMLMLVKLADAPRSADAKNCNVKIKLYSCSRGLNGSLFY